MNKKNYPFDLVDEANNDLKKYKKEIQIVRYENAPEFYSIDILDIDKNGKICGITTFLDNIYEEDLKDVVNDAWANARLKSINDAEIEAIKDKFISFRILNRWIHDMPALIYSITSVDLYFHDFNTDGIEKVNVSSIDEYEHRNGEFCVHEDDYEIAEQQILG